MLLLRVSTDTVQLITSATGDIDVVASYVDRDTTTFVTGLAESQYTNIVTATTTPIVATAPAGKVRNVKALNIRNVATTSMDVTVLVDVSAVTYELYKVTLLGGQTLQYVEGAGFVVVATTALLNRTMLLNADSVHATAATFANIGNLNVPLISGKFYNFLANLYHISNATTTGAQFAYNIGAAPTIAIISTIDTVTASVTASVHSAGTVTARDTAVTAQTTGSAAITMAIISGMIQPSADGTFAMRATSEVTVANGLTVKAGSWLHMWEPTT